MPIQEHFYQLNFDEPLNVSLQPGDEIYFTPIGSTSVVDDGTSFNINSQSVKYSGSVHLVFETSIVVMFICDDALYGQPTNPCLDQVPNPGDFIMFSKDNSVNLSSLLGYYAEVEVVNDSNEKAKLFAVSTDISESSK